MVFVAAAFGWMTVIGGVIAWAYARSERRPEAPPQIRVHFNVDSDRLARSVAAASRNIDAMREEQA
jgi:hypothetical protein